jgi:hypothetical protein
MTVLIVIGLIVAAFLAGRVVQFVSDARSAMGRRDRRADGSR